VCPNATTLYTPADSCVAFYYPEPVEVYDACNQTFVLTLCQQGYYPPSSRTCAFSAFENLESGAAQSVCHYGLTVVDNVAPLITCSASISTTTSPGKCTRNVSYPFANATDNCRVQSTTLVRGPVSGSLFPAGVTTVGFQSIDVHHNAQNCTFAVSVADNEAPLISTQPMSRF
jgi:hypothetical protein